MSALSAMGRLLILVGVGITLLGGLLLLGGRIPGIGCLPGDFVFRRGGLTVYFPLTTSILLSLLLTLILWLFRR